MNVTTIGATIEMNFEWDEIKNKQNIRKHGFDLADGQQLFTGGFTFFRKPGFPKGLWRGAMEGHRHPARSPDCRCSFYRTRRRYDQDHISNRLLKKSFKPSLRAQRSNLEVHNTLISRDCRVAASAPRNDKIYSNCFFQQPAKKSEFTREEIV